MAPAAWRRAFLEVDRSMNKDRSVNLLGAFVDAMYRRVEVRINAELGMGGEGPAAIVIIGTNPGRTVDFLARALELSHSGTVRLVDRLAEGQLVQRRACADRRAVALVLTERGRRRMRAILRARRHCLDQVFDVLTAKDQLQLTRSLELMLTSITTSDPVAETICRLCDEAACPQPKCPVTLAVPA
jgi:MarR family transcriptional regulator, negative regulator of the multidrug operon emrRAB